MNDYQIIGQRCNRMGVLYNMGSIEGNLQPTSIEFIGHSIHVGGGLNAYMTDRRCTLSLRKVSYFIRNHIMV